LTERFGGLIDPIDHLSNPLYPPCDFFSPPILFLVCYGSRKRHNTPFSGRIDIERIQAFIRKKSAFDLCGYGCIAYYVVRPRWKQKDHH